jgi:O-acetyl-ADP-ribose deacetylase (regulator of RNase III)
MNIIHRGKLKHLEFTFATGDLFDAKVDAIVSSEQTDLGTVVDTAGGKDFARIFHAGFHEPDDWRGASGSSQDADYFQAIGLCIRQVLNLARMQKLSSVAFPLIGCGHFGLDERMLIQQFLDALDDLDELLNDGENFNVWLVIRDRAQFNSAISIFIELLLRGRSELTKLQIPRTGVPILDRFAVRLARRCNEE